MAERDGFRGMLDDVASSKKAMAMISAVGLTVLVLLLTRIGLDQATANSIGATLMTGAVSYVLGQSVADHGKEAAQVHADGAVEVAKIAATAPPATQQSVTVNEAPAPVKS